MSIEEKLLTTIECNPNITDKIWFKNNLQFVHTVYNMYDVDYNFENIIDIVKNLKIMYQDDKSTCYDKINNCIIIGTVSENSKFDLCKVFLELTSQSYDEINKRYNNGLIIYNEDGTLNDESVEFNDNLISKLITYTTGISKENNDTAKQIELDEKLKLVTDKVGYKDLVTYFAYANGDLLYSKINSDEQKIIM